MSFYLFPWQITMFHRLSEDFWFTFSFASNKKIQEGSWKALNLESPKYLPIGAYFFGVNYNEFRIMVLFVWGGRTIYIYILYVFCFQFSYLSLLSIVHCFRLPLLSRKAMCDLGDGLSVFLWCFLPQNCGSFLSNSLRV